MFLHFKKAFNSVVSHKTLNVFYRHGIHNPFLESDHTDLRHRPCLRESIKTNNMLLDVPFKTN